MQINPYFASTKLEENYRVYLEFGFQTTLFFIDRKIIDLIPELFDGLRKMTINPLQMHTYHLPGITQSDFCDWLSVLTNRKEIQNSFDGQDFKTHLLFIYKKKKEKQPLSIEDRLKWIQVSRDLGAFVEILEELSEEELQISESLILETASFLQIRDFELFIVDHCKGPLEIMIPDFLEKYVENNNENIENGILQLKDIRLKKFFVRALEPPLYRNIWEHFVFPAEKKKLRVSETYENLLAFFRLHSLLYQNCFAEILRLHKDLLYSSDEEVIYLMIENFVSSLNLLLEELQVFFPHQSSLHPGFMTDLLFLEQIGKFVIKKIKIEFNEECIESEKINYLFKDHLLLKQIIRSAKSIYAQKHGLEEMLVMEFVASYLNLHVWGAVDKTKVSPPFLELLERCLSLIGCKKEEKFVHIAIHTYIRKGIEMMDLQKKLDVDSESYKIEKDLMANLARDFPLDLVNQWGEGCEVYYNRTEMFSKRVKLVIDIERDRKRIINNLAVFFRTMPTLEFSTPY